MFVQRMSKPKADCIAILGTTTLYAISNQLTIPVTLASNNNSGCTSAMIGSGSHVNRQYLRFPRTQTQKEHMSIYSKLAPANKPLRTRVSAPITGASAISGTRTEAATALLVFELLLLVVPELVPVDAVPAF